MCCTHLPPTNTCGKIIFSVVSVILFMGVGVGGRRVKCYHYLYYALDLTMTPNPKQPFLPPANEVSGKVICLQVCVCPWGMLVTGGCLLWGGAWCGRPPMATAASGMHPTGMHSCLVIIAPCECTFRRVL